MSYAYTPPSTISTLQTWPTLESLIANNTRLVTFVASLNPATNAVAPYLLDEFTFVSENPFEVTSLSGFSCQPDRPSSVKGNAQSAISSGLLPLMNHFKDIAQIFGVVVPDVWNVGITNAQSGAVGNLGDAAAQCKLVYGKAPTFILVDFFDVGPAINTVDSLNSITASGRTAPPIQSTKSAGLGRGDLLSDVSSRLNSYVGLFLALWMALALF